ncbi:MAG: A24 family peptidase [Candidatus Nanoarchaeia archaeon]
MLSFALICVAIILTAIATISDLKTKLIPDWSSYALLAIGLLGNAAVSINQTSPWPFVKALLGAAIFFGAGYFLYRIGAWGGGDVKLVSGLGAVLGPAEPIAIWPALFSFWLNALIFGAIFGIAGMVLLLWRNRKAIVSKIQKNKKIKIILAFGTFSLIILSIFSMLISQILFILFVAFLIFSVFMFKIFEEECFFKKLKPSQLVEGDWIVDEIVLDNFVYKPKKIGVEAQDIRALIELEKAGKLKEVKVKDGIPYVPALFAALLMSLLKVDLFYAFLSMFWF